MLSPALTDHHLRVAYVGASLATELGLDPEDTREIAIAGALHDVGAESLATRISLLRRSLSRDEHCCSMRGDAVHQHAIDGSKLLCDFPPFANAARAIRFHHVDWDFGRGEEAFGEQVPLSSHILRLADQAAVLPQGDRFILNQAASIRSAIAKGAGRLYKAELVDAFAAASSRESFWLDLASPYKEEIIRPHFGEHGVALDSGELYELARLFGRIIDYRSRYTATHSAKVATAAELLAGLAGMDEQQKRILGLAGYLHDLGKLAVPSEILDKPGRLTQREELVARQHAYHTRRILSMVPGLEQVSLYAALHHERLDGGGYPFRSRDIPLGARIVAVADIFSAVTEDRPYRAGMTWEQSIGVLDELVRNGGLDGGIVALVRNHSDKFGRFVLSRDAAFPMTAHVAM
jgi:HD-GYP domain-containing protein (c-di-GMP phosphodiesterase class II)